MQGDLVLFLLRRWVHCEAFVDVVCFEDADDVLYLSDNVCLQVLDQMGRRCVDIGFSALPG